MNILRTPDERFAGLPDYAFAPHYTEVASGDGGTLRIHHIDEGPRGAAPVLLMHGEPSWCYLYRKIAPALATKGHRAVAPDLVGFGRSLRHRAQLLDTRPHRGEPRLQLLERLVRPSLDRDRLVAQLEQPGLARVGLEGRLDLLQFAPGGGQCRLRALLLGEA